MYKVFLLVALAAFSTQAQAEEGAQEGAALDCPVQNSSAVLKAGLGNAMTGAGDEAERDNFFKQLGVVVDGCAEKHALADVDLKEIYYNYSLARIAREWLIVELEKSDISTGLVDTALDFSAGRTNPDLTGDMTEDQVNAVVQAYVKAGVDVEKIPQSVWEQVGAYAASTSIYWNNRQQLKF